MSLAMMFAAAALAAVPQTGLAGRWSTEGGWATVVFSSCPDAADRVCGRIVALRTPLDRTGRPKRDTANPDPALRTRPIVGMPFLTGFKPTGSGRWTGGRIYNPGDGKTYAARMALDGDGALKVSGCVLVVCRTQLWTRAAR